MSAFLDLVGIYAKQGLTLRTGLYPWHFKAREPGSLPSTNFFRGGRRLSSGGGIALVEIHFFETLFEHYSPKRIFLIGNALGFSSILIAMLNRSSTVVALDAGTEGYDNDYGTELTNRIAAEEGLPLEVVKGSSPQDVGPVVDSRLGGRIDFAFIDGLHTNAQQSLDFEACHRHAADGCVYCLHDVLSWNLLPSYRRLAETHPDLVSRILWRTPSGMGMFYPSEAPDGVKGAIEAFSESDEMLEHVQKELRMARIEGRVPGFVRKLIPLGLIRTAQKWYYGKDHDTA